MTTSAPRDGRSAAAATNHLLDFARARHYAKVLGHPLTQSEVNFFSAYKVHAARIGVDADLEVADDTTSMDRIAESVERFKLEWPEVAARFSVS